MAAYKELRLWTYGWLDANEIKEHAAWQYALEKALEALQGGTCMLPSVTPGQIAYEIYGMCRSNLSLIVWAAQTPEGRATWEAVAAAVLGHAAHEKTTPGYAATGGRCCPACGGADIAHDNETTFTNCAIRRVMLCEDCGAGWRAVYTLTGYEDLRLPLKETPCVND